MTVKKIIEGRECKTSIRLVRANDNKGKKKAGS
jgi:hypothetical protein